MYYYKVLPKDPSFFSEKFLTYESTLKISMYSLVKISLKKNTVIGVVVSNTTKPSFRTNPIIELIDNISPLPDESIGLLNWIHSYYPGPLGSLLQQFIPGNLGTNTKNNDVSITTKHNHYTSLPKLTAEQNNVLKNISSYGSYLLHGDTGTGKTRIYIELAINCLRNGKSALILTPEISLTPQLAADFENIFKDRVIVIHSKLTPVQRLRNWTRILNDNNGLVVLGPRSALFSPFKSLGLVVIDESHESSYKQEQSPHYHANRVGSKLAQLHKAIFLLGSATPSITDYYLAKTKNVPILRMKKSAVKVSSDAIEKILIDLKDHSLFTRSRFISDKLISCIENAINHKEQSLLFLNRRGTARIIFCENCGWQSLCPNCDIPLVYHGDSFDSRCHTCGHKEKPANSCPTCGEQKIIYQGFGTKALMNEVSKLFPHAKIKRFDNDNAKSESFEQNYSSVKTGETDIIVGTQTLIKGLDLPLLSVVGIMTAESSLSFPDYTASENTYQQINQVLGRIGRGHRNGTAIIQTYSPSNQIIQDSLSLNYEDYYSAEIAERMKYNFPPFTQILKLTCLRSTQKNAETSAKKLNSIIKDSGNKVTVSGPTPSFYAKIDKKFQYQLIVRSSSRSELIKTIRQLPAGWLYDIDPINLL